MGYSTRTALGIKDSHLELDTAHFKNVIESHDNQVVVHLIQSYPLRCPRCGQLMLKNGFKIVNVLGPSLHYQPTIWSIRNQKYLCKPHQLVHQRLRSWLRSRTLNIVITSAKQLNNR